MKEVIAKYAFVNAEQLANALSHRVEGRHMSEVLMIGGIDRLELIEETLSDKSKVYNMRLCASTAAERKRERE
jgi:hypothetical protein